MVAPERATPPVLTVACPMVLMMLAIPGCAASRATAELDGGSAVSLLQARDQPAGRDAVRRCRVCREPGGGEPPRAARVRALLQSEAANTLEVHVSESEAVHAGRKNTRSGKATLLAVAMQWNTGALERQDPAPAPGQEQGSVHTGRGYCAVGIVLALLGQTVTVAGLQLQKISHAAQKQDQPEVQAVASADSHRPYFMRWKWIVGGLVWASGHLLCWCALGLAPWSILACLQSWNILVTFALAPYILGEERPDHAAYYGALLISGCVLAVAFGPRPAVYKTQTLSTLSHAFFDFRSVLLHSACAGLLGLILFVPFVRALHWRVVRYVCLSAVSAWYSALCSKSVSMLTITTLSTHQSQLQDVGFWGFLLAFVICAVGQIHFLNMALRHGLACTVLPMFEGLSLLGHVFFGGILFREFQDFSGGEVFGFVPGILCLLLGLFLLVRGTNTVQLPSRSEANESAATSDK